MSAPPSGPAHPVPGYLPDHPAPPPPRRRHRTRTLALVLAGVLALAALGWQTSEFARESWWSSQPHVALDAGQDLQGFTITSAEVSRLETVQTWEGSWPVPDGFQLWAVSLAVQTQQDEVSSVVVFLEDESGRVFEAAENTPWGVDGYEDMLRVATPGADDDPLPPVQQLLVLTPDDAVPVAVRVEGEYSLNPEFFRLPVQG